MGWDGMGWNLVVSSLLEYDGKARHGAAHHLFIQSVDGGMGEGGGEGGGEGESERVRVRRGCEERGEEV